MLLKYLVLILVLLLSCCNAGRLRKGREWRQLRPSCGSLDSLMHSYPRYPEFPPSVRFPDLFPFPFFARKGFRGFGIPENILDRRLGKPCQGPVIEPLIYGKFVLSNDTLRFDLKACHSSMNVQSRCWSYLDNRWTTRSWRYLFNSGGHRVFQQKDGASKRVQCSGRDAWVYKQSHSYSSRSRHSWQFESLSDGQRLSRKQTCKRRNCLFPEGGPVIRKVRSFMPNLLCLGSN